MKSIQQDSASDLMQTFGAVALLLLVGGLILAVGRLRESEAPCIPIKGDYMTFIAPDDLKTKATIAPGYEAVICKEQYVFIKPKGTS